MPRRALLVGVGNLQNGLLPEGLTQQLQPDGQLRRLSETARKADAADAGKIAGQSEHVREIHLQRVVRLLTDLERGSLWKRTRHVSAFVTLTTSRP